MKKKKALKEVEYWKNAYIDSQQEVYHWEEKSKEWESRAHALREQRTRIHHLCCQAGIQTHVFDCGVTQNRELDAAMRVELLTRKYNELKQDVIDWKDILDYTMNGGGKFDQKGYLDKLSKLMQEAIGKCQAWNIARSAAGS